MQPAADLLGRPALLKLCCSEIVQARPRREAADFQTARRVPRAAVRAHCAVLGSAAVLRQLAANERRRSVEATADGAVGLAGRQSGGDAFALVEGQHAVRALAEAGRDATLKRMTPWTSPGFLARSAAISRIKSPTR